MDKQKLSKHSQDIKNQATKILDSTGILEILKKHGKVFLVGSYPLDVMYGPDIDIIVESGDTRKSAVETLNEIVDKELFRKVEFGDFVKYPLEDRPKGYILVLKAVVENVKWEIEIWFLEDAKEQIKHFDFVKSKITDENRLEILMAKHLREMSGKDKKSLSSFKIYEDVLSPFDTIF